MPGRSATRFDLERRLAEPLRAARAEAHAAAFGDQRPGAGQPEPAARAGDDRNLVGESEIHCTAIAPPVRSFSRQSNWRNVTLNSFFWKNSFSSGSRCGVTKAMIARSIGER